MKPRLGILKQPLWLAIPAMVILVFLLDWFRLIDFHELDGTDLKFRARGRIKAHPDITLVMIDDPSLAAFGRWPWPRRLHARFLELLSKYNPKAVFFDVLFMEEAPDPGEDDALHAAIQKSGNVILPFFYQSESPWHAAFPVKRFQEAARGIGFVNLITDPDAHVRRFKVFLENEAGVFYPPSVLIAAPEKGIDHAGILKWVKRLPLGPAQDLWIDYPGTLESFRFVSFSDVVKLSGLDNAARLEDLFKDRIVLIGHTATGTGMIDIKPTPFSPHDPGVLVLASTVHTLLAGRFIRPVPGGFQFLILLLLAGAIAGASVRVKPLAGLGIGAGAAVLYAAVSFLSFIHAGILLPLFAPLTVMALSYGIVLLVKFIEVLFLRELSERELQAAYQIQSNFLPQNLPESDCLDAAFECQFSKGVGGDLYAWAGLGEGRFGFCAGDVSGKGMPAALYMAKAVSDFRSIDKKNLTPGEVCTALNVILTASGISNMFLTLIYAEVDTVRGVLRYTSCGHEPMLFWRASDGKVALLEDSKGMPLGMFDDTAYETAECLFMPGDALMIFTDGVRELRNPDKEEFGVKKAADAFGKFAAQGLCSREIVRRIFEIMKSYQKGVPAHDDRTLLCLKCLKAGP